MKKLVFVFVMLAVIYAGLYALGRYQFEPVFYQVESEKIEGKKIRVIELTDLHNWTFGKGNKDLVEEIRNLKPDIIAIAGDMVLAGNSDISVAVSLCEELVKIAPVYYSFGNHENELVYGSDFTPEFLGEMAEKVGVEEDRTVNYEKIPMVDARLPELLKKCGVTILNNACTSIQVKGIPVDIAGMNLLSGAFYPYGYFLMERFLGNETEHVKLIIAHYPSVPLVGIETQLLPEFEVAMCGHKHGGIIRIPGKGGMFSANGFWPWFTGKEAGEYTTDQGKVIISRGLGNSNFLPRINNVPELSVIDLI